jgi:hypothetical protein
VSTHHLAIQLAANAGSALGSHPVPESLVRNVIVTAAAMERMLPCRSINLELCVGRALAIRETVLTPREAADLVRSCDAVLEDVE